MRCTKRLERTGPELHIVTSMRLDMVGNRCDGRYSGRPAHAAERLGGKLLGSQAPPAACVVEVFPG
jgi:hypothetical protein